MFVAHSHCAGLSASGSGWPRRKRGHSCNSSLTLREDPDSPSPTLLGQAPALSFFLPFLPPFLPETKSLVAQANHKLGM